MTSDPDQIRSNIEQTQAHLSADVDALADKVSPPRIVERRVQQTRSAVTSFKDTIMGRTTDATSAMGDTAGSAKDTLAAKASSAADLASSAPDQARLRTRGNPLAAGLIVFGAGWLLSSLLPATEREQEAATQLKELAQDKGAPVAQQLGQAGQEAAQNLRESAQQRAQTVKQTATDAASVVVDQAHSQASDVTSHAQDSRDRVTEQASPADRPATSSSPQGVI